MKSVSLEDLSVVREEVQRKEGIQVKRMQQLEENLLEVKHLLEQLVTPKSQP